MFAIVANCDSAVPSMHCRFAIPLSPISPYAKKMIPESERIVQVVTWI